MPLISIIVPIYNVEKYLHKCINSILLQTFSNFECILVDDHSSDSSSEICDEFAKRDTRIKIIHNSQNKGCPQSRKTGFDTTIGDYILFIDSDDWIEENMLETLYKKATNEDLDIVYCGLFINTENKQEKYDNPFLENKIEMIKQIVVWGKFTPSVCNKLIKREIYQKIIFPYTNYGEDRQITIQAIHYSKRIGFVREVLYHYRRNNNSLCLNKDTVLQRYTDEYNIALWSINFLHNNSYDNTNTLEFELNNYINSLKLHFIIEKPIRNLSKLHELYPSSNQYIFDTTWSESFYKKVFLFLAVNNFPCVFSLIDFFLMLINITKFIYRICIPPNIRKHIWQKRNIKQNS
jgi:glycosyltransferase involved in cell wall biosynthesis